MYENLEIFIYLTKYNMADRSDEINAALLAQAIRKINDPKEQERIAKRKAKMLQIVKEANEAEEWKNNKNQ